MWKGKYEKNFFKKSPIQPSNGVLSICKLPFLNGSYCNWVCKTLWALSVTPKCWIFTLFIGNQIWAGLVRQASIFLRLRWKTIGRENVDQKQTYVVVCNHQTALDVLATAHVRKISSLTIQQEDVFSIIWKEIWKFCRLQIAKILEMWSNFNYKFLHIIIF